MIELVAVAGIVAFCSAMFFLVWAAHRDKVVARSSSDARDGDAPHVATPSAASARRRG